MPKEYIEGSARWMPSGDPSGLIPLTPFLVSLGWSREENGGMVSLATIRNKDFSTDPADGLYVDLDRKQINQLIKVLRRARDQAFGKDE